MRTWADAAMVTTISRPSARREVLITGGGTAGHVEPALAVAAALEELGVARSAILFVGAQRGMEASLVPAAGYEITLLPGRGILRRFALQNVASVFQLILGGLLATALVARTRPRAVVMVGGYAGVAASLAAALFKIPVVVVNVDATPGLANRLVGKVASASAVAVAGSGLPKETVTGAPVRDEVRRAARDEEARRAARAALSIGEGRRVIAVVGGSLGAKRLNDAALELRVRYGDRSDIAIYHVAGRRNFEEVESLVAATPVGAGVEYHLVAYEEALPTLFVAADLVVCRAGAMTVAELCAIGVASLLVPLPGAPGDHQTKNAAALEQAGAAVVLRDADATGLQLATTVDALLADGSALSAMDRAAKALGRPDAAKAIAHLVDQVRQDGTRKVA